MTNRLNKRKLKEYVALKTQLTEYRKAMEEKIGTYKTDWNVHVVFEKIKSDYGSYIVVYNDKHKNKDLKLHGSFNTLFVDGVPEWLDGSMLTHEDKEQLKWRLAWWKTDWDFGICTPFG